MAHIDQMFEEMPLLHKMACNALARAKIIPQSSKDCSIILVNLTGDWSITYEQEADEVYEEHS